MFIIICIGGVYLGGGFKVLVKNDVYEKIMVYNYIKVKRFI